MSDLTTSRVNRAGQRIRRIARGQVTDSERLPVQVSQMMKRVPAIIDKLLCEPTLPLSRMQDIGGCRAILPTISNIRAVQERLARPSRAHELVAVSDHIEDPRDPADPFGRRW